jgi:uncharacterized protein YjlB
MFAGDGVIPNNPRLPMLVYPGAIDLTGTADPEALFEKTFARHGWGDMWRNGIYPYVHYHSTIHEALGIARGRAKVRIGGAQGRELDLIPGDVALLPAGTGHQCLWAARTDGHRRLSEDRTLQYLPRQQAEHAKALKSIAKVPMPDSDPVRGRHGPLLRLCKLNDLAPAPFAL